MKITDTVRKVESLCPNEASKWLFGEKEEDFILFSASQKRSTITKEKQDLHF